ncbi:hypothetical protein ACLOJK_014060 [Asimina triloba]
MIRSPTRRVGYMEDEGIKRISTNISIDQTSPSTRNLFSPSRLIHRHRFSPSLPFPSGLATVRSSGKIRKDSLQGIHREGDARKWKNSDSFKKLMVSDEQAAEADGDQASKGLKRTVKMRMRRRRWKEKEWRVWIEQKMGRVRVGPDVRLLSSRRRSSSRFFSGEEDDAGGDGSWLIEGGDEEDEGEEQMSKARRMR